MCNGKWSLERMKVIPFIHMKTMDAEFFLALSNKWLFIFRNNWTILTYCNAIKSYAQEIWDAPCEMCSL